MIYIDQMMKHRAYPRATRPQCFMVADTLQELHQAAAKIGLPRGAFNYPPVHQFPHYRLGYNQRETALTMGAVVIAHTRMASIAEKSGFVQRANHTTHEEVEPAFNPIHHPQDF